MSPKENSYRPSKNEENPWVMYLIVRASLNMSAGKTAAQVGHAVGMIYEKYLKLFVKNSILKNASSDDLAQMSAFEEWDGHANRKVVLRADDQQFDKVKAECGAYIVRDAGLTEIEAGSETVIALWPAQKESFPKIIKRLQVLK